MSANWNGATGKFVFARDLQTSAAGCQDRERGTPRQEVRNHGRGGENLLEIIEQHQELMVVKRRLDNLASWAPAASRIPTARAMAGSTRSGSRTVANGTKTAPSAKAGRSCSSTRSARRVLPTPPGPRRVRREISSRRRRAEISAIRVRARSMGYATAAGVVEEQPE